MHKGAHSRGTQRVDRKTLPDYAFTCTFGRMKWYNVKKEEIAIYLMKQLIVDCVTISKMLIFLI